MPKRSRSGVVSRPGARGGADQRERRQVERDDRARPRPAPTRDRQLAVLHRRIEGLLDRAREPVDLVDEEDRARLERGQEGGDVALALERRAGGLHERRRSSSCGDDLRERGLAEARAGRRAARGRAPRRARRAASMKIAELLLQRAPGRRTRRAARAQRAVELVLGARAARGPGCARRRACGCRLIGARPQRVGDQVLGRLAGAPVEQRVGLLRREAEADAGPRGRACAGRRRGRPRSGRRPARRRPSRAARR